VQKQSKAKGHSGENESAGRELAGRQVHRSIVCSVARGGHAVLFAMGGWREVIDQPLASKVGHVVGKNSVLWLLPVVVQDAENQCGAR
jgi:hypothetical protein